MLHGKPQFHIKLQVICFFVAIFGALILIIDILIGTFLIGGAVTVLALDCLYLVNEDDRDGK